MYKNNNLEKILKCYCCQQTDQSQHKKSSRRGVKGKEGTKGKRAHLYLTESAGDESWRGEKK